MKFKKSYWNYIIIAAVLIILLSPIKGYIQKFFLVSDETGTVLEANTLNINLKGVNVPNTNLSDLKGKTIFLNYWGTWCPPCVQEMPSIQKLYEMKGKEMTFVLIAMRDKEDRVKAFLDKNHYTMPVYIAESPIDKTIKPGVFPTTYIINKQGKVVYQWTGELDWASPKSINTIDSLAH